MSDGRQYRILGVLGEGGFGSVYRAEMLGDGGFQRAVALKVLRSEVEGVADVALRLRDEARLLGLLDHRAIVDVLGLVRLDDRWTIVMEHVEGVDLHDLVVGGKVPLGVALEIGLEVASALHVAWDTEGPDGQPMHLVHRDIKPHNVMITAAGAVKVLDFGIARANFRAREASTQRVLFGSPGYMAPERFEHDERPAGDVYSLGVTLWEIVTGDTWGHTQVTPKAFAERHTSAWAAVDGPLDVLGLLKQMTAYDADERPSAREVERALRDLRAPLGAPWLRDWAEEVVPGLPKRALQPHDFSRDIVTESRLTGRPDTGAVPAEQTLAQLRSLPTFNPDDDGMEEARDRAIREATDAREASGVAAPASPPPFKPAAPPPGPTPEPARQLPIPSRQRGPELPERRSNLSAVSSIGTIAVGTVGFVGISVLAVFLSMFVCCVFTCSSGG